jgi:ketosteroid isomerase-like protein
MLKMPLGALAWMLFQAVGTQAQGPTTLTDSLVHAFHDAWNANDLDGMVAMLQPDAFFRSPFQLRYGRETMAATVLRANPPVIKDCVTREVHSRVDGDLAWSLGHLYCNRYYPSGGIRLETVRIEGDSFLRNLYDETGQHTATRQDEATRYTYVFTRTESGVWKVQMLIYHESSG